MPIENPAFSLVIPAYNEAKRLPPFLESVREHLASRYPGGYEVIVVDDGSRDRMGEVLAPLTAVWSELRYLRHEQNQGKGAAVRTGVLASRGDLVLFADADGATPIDQEPKLAEAIRAGADAAVGSRLLAAADARRSRHWLRRLLGGAFALVARRLLMLSVRDTQCGFKMFRGDVGRRLFSLVEENGYMFDLELLALASRLGYTVAEVPVNWSEVPGGQLSVTRDFGRILADLWRVRRRVRRQNSPRPGREKGVKC